MSEAKGLLVRRTTAPLVVFGLPFQKFLRLFDSLIKLLLAYGFVDGLQSHLARHYARSLQEMARVGANIHDRG